MAEEKDDDNGIHDDCGLLRRIPDSPNNIVFDQNLKRLRPSSANFRDVELSVDNLNLLKEDGLDHNYTIANFPDYGLIEITAGVVRSPQSGSQRIVTDAIEDNPYHTLIVGAKGKGAANHMSRNCKLIILPLHQRTDETS